MSEHHYSHELVDKVTERLCDHEHGVPRARTEESR